ncbi:hypothetical protein CAMRE0001_0034 [Campylobacter rectus RM3267]|uniref:Uncharacterized protein n=1 Tax=Campylobacter rectus RM3267 TaxID=553218 RepID=B9D3I1_CAMRE|nr:hypothetical protein CAMRE0001_0034 [Campylobacter rectus RM3267]
MAAKFKFTKFEQAQRPSGKNPNLTELKLVCKFNVRFKITRNLFALRL